MWRGTGRRRAVDALEAARLREITLNACIDELIAERDKLAAREQSLDRIATHLAQQFDAEVRAHAATARKLADAQQALADAQARHAEQLAAVEAAHAAEIAALKAAHADERAELVAYRTDACNRRAITLPRLGEVAVPHELVRTAPAGIDVREVRAKHAARPEPVVAPVAGERNGLADTLTLPLPAAPDAEPAIVATPPKVTPIGHVKPIPASEDDTRPTVTVRHLADLTTGSAK